MAGRLVASVDDRLFATGKRAYATGNYRSAAAAWRPLAAGGDPRAQYRLGRLHERGEGVAPDGETARALYTAAALSGFGPAQLALGRMLAHTGAPLDDLAEALTWLILAEERDVVGAAALRQALAPTLSSTDVRLAELRAERCRLSQYRVCAVTPTDGRWQYAASQSR
ncbi:hypothetical protein CKO24_04390 [Rhodothalassium salexigens DSM 2132]|nr:hypothetical protein [Rhodothalassium salexigens DSM 2132]